jgi:HEAT repeat protein
MPRRADAAPVAKSAQVEQSLDDALRLPLHGVWSFDAAPPELLRLGRPALERLLDAPTSAFWSTDTEARDYGSLRNQAIAAFAKADMDGVLLAMKRRKWTDVRIALSGVALLQDARVVPFLVRAYADKAPLTRALAIEYLGSQRDPAATATVQRALRDRSSDVRLAAIRALGSIGDPGTIEALQATLARNPSAPLVADEIKLALKKIRRAASRARGK